MKTIGYLIFAGVFYICRLFYPIKNKKVFGIMTHDGSMDGNVGSILEYLNERKEGYTFHTIKNEDRKNLKNFYSVQRSISFFLMKPYHLATSEFVLLDNVFLPMAYIKFSKKVRVIQLWHGTGTIKRFGQDVNTGKLKKLEKRANSTITHLIVNSEDTRRDYAKAFGVEEDKVYLYGLPRTDLFFDQKEIEKRKQRFYEQYPALYGKKLILYAPTFRDQEKDHPKLVLDTELLSKELPEDYIILLRLHPFVMEAYLKQEGSNHYNEEKVISMSAYEDINTLLLVSDYLITDYSSVIFEYCLREKPIIFFAYDVEVFSDHGRGFYHTYEEYVPGPVVRDTKAVLKVIKENKFDYDKIRKFSEKSYYYLDGKSKERIYYNIIYNKT